jgi:phage tail-like protein
LDPYKNFKFRVKCDGADVAAVSNASVFKRTTEVVSHRDGGGMSTPHKSPGRTNCDAITFDRGLTQDMNFHNWAAPDRRRS